MTIFGIGSILYLLKRFMIMLTVIFWISLRNFVVSCEFFSVWFHSSTSRYFAIVWPVVHHLWTIKTYYTLLALVWFISTFASCFALEGSKWGQRYNILNFVFLYCIPLIVIAFCYLSILRKTQERFHSPSRKSMRRELKVSSTVFILVLLFIITWSPFFVCTIAMWLTTVTVRSIIFTKCFHFMNSFCNPIVYAARIPDFRMAFSEVLPKSLVQFLCCRSKTHLDSPASSRTRTSSAMSVGTYTQKCSPKCSKESRRHLTSNETKPGSIRKKAPQESIRSTSTSMSPEYCAPAMKSSTPLAFGGLQHTYVWSKGSSKIWHRQKIPRWKVYYQVNSKLFWQDRLLERWITIIHEDLI